MRRSPQAGSASLELAVIAPAVLALVGLVVFAGRVESAHQVAAQAAEDAARAATVARDSTSSQAAARAAAAADLAGECEEWNVTLTGGFTPGATVTAHVACTRRTGFVPGSITATDQASAAVDLSRRA